MSKYQLNPVTGEWPVGSWDNPTGALPLRGRIQFSASEAADPNSVYISEAIYISEHDQMAGNGRNNASWRQFEFSGGSVSNLVNTIPSQSGVFMFNPAIFAWQEFHSDVHIDELVNTNEGGAGVHGYIFVASKATDIGNGIWRYDYAIQNLNSKQAVGSFDLPVINCPIQNMGFHDVDHHSGSPWKNDDWAGTMTGGAPSWSTDTFAADPNANAIRWGMMTNFSFESGAAPAANLGPSHRRSLRARRGHLAAGRRDRPRRHLHRLLRRHHHELLLRERQLRPTRRRCVQRPGYPERDHQRP